METIIQITKRTIYGRKGKANKSYETTVDPNLIYL